MVVYEMKLVWSVLMEDAPQLPVKTARQVYDYAMRYCYKEPTGVEVLWMLFVDKAGTIYGQIELSKGGMEQVVIDRKIVAKSAIESMAKSVILVHNHPAGKSMPSVEDIKQTDAIRRALSAIDVPLLDHVIVGNNEFYSFAEERKLTI